jgi:hypothetical protein
MILGTGDIIPILHKAITLVMQQITGLPLPMAQQFIPATVRQMLIVLSVRTAPSKEDALMLLTIQILRMNALSPGPAAQDHASRLVEMDFVMEQGRAIQMIIQQTWHRGRFVQEEARFQVYVMQHGSAQTMIMQIMHIIISCLDTKHRVTAMVVEAATGRELQANQTVPRAHVSVRYQVHRVIAGMENRTVGVIHSRNAAVMTLRQITGATEQMQHVFLVLMEQVQIQTHIFALPAPAAYG